MKTILTALLALAMVVAFSLSSLGCNTMRGAGKDIQKGGQAIQDAATKVEQGK